jgi:phosphatidylinositol mannoside-binding LppM-like protein
MLEIGPRVRVSLALGVAVLLLSGCRVMVETAIQPDGSGLLVTSVVFSADEARNFAQGPGNQSKSICDNIRPDLPEDAAFEERERGGETYCTTIRPFADLQELRQLYARMNNVTVHELQFELGRLTVDLTVDTTRAAAEGPVPQEWRMTLPGTLEDHNADQVDGRTLVWTISPDQQVNLLATTTVGLNLQTLGPAGVLLLASGCGLGLALAAGVLYLSRRREHRASA